MKRLGKSILILMLTMVMVLGSCMTVFATGSIKQKGSSSNDSYSALMQVIMDGTTTDRVKQKVYDFSGERYKRSSGGYFNWWELLGSDARKIASGDELPFNDDNLNQLTSKAKQDFLSDVMTLAYAEVSNSEAGMSTNGITTETVERLTEMLQGQTGLGSALLASLLQSTKPDYITANRIWAPFSGPVGVILGILSIAVMALLGVTMAIDICYITIPAVQMALSDGEAGGQGGQGGKAKGLSGLVSIEAKKAVDIAANGGGNGQGGSGEHKAAVGQYFKFRWKGLVMLVICLLYLVQGEIYSFIGMFIDLFSGLLGG